MTNRLQKVQDAIATLREVEGGAEVPSGFYADLRYLLLEQADRLKGADNVAVVGKPYASVEFEEIEVQTYRGEDGKLVVDILGPGDDDCLDDGQPDIRVWMNEALIYRSGEVGDDLSGGTFPMPLKDSGS